MILNCIISVKNLRGLNMEQNLEDLKMYKEFLDGNENSLGKLMEKYKSNLIYFIFKYVQNAEAAEDIYQDVVLYLLEKKEVYNFEYSFKTFIYMIAKTRALNYLKKEKIKNNYINNEKNFEIEEDLLEKIIFSNELKRKIKNVISKMCEEYQMVIYLAIIEDLPYLEIAKIMEKNVSQVKNLLHRARAKLRKLLIEERVVEMKNNKFIRFLAFFIVFIFVATGLVYGVTKIYEKVKKEARLTPTFTSEISNTDTNKIWIGTFNLVWNDLMDDVIKGPVEFEDGYSELANELNKQDFTEENLSEDSYYKIHGNATNELKEKIEKDIKEKFNEDSKILNKVNWSEDAKNSNYILYSILKKEFKFIKPFETLEDDNFNGSEEKVKYFGLEPGRANQGRVNVEILFYNNKEDFAVKLKTQEGDEVYLYKTTGEGKRFEENYNEMLEKEVNYSGSREFTEDDILKVPYIDLSAEINYDELCGRYIKGTNIYIEQALQTVDFELNNYGGSVKSEVIIELTKQTAIYFSNRKFCFDSDFLLYLKEENKDKPYMALKVDDVDILQKN